MNTSFIQIFNSVGAKGLLNALGKYEDLRLYLDTETSGFDANDPTGIKVLQLGFKTENSTLQIVLIKGDLLYGELAPAWVKLLETSKQVIIHNAKFDLKFLAGIGCTITKIKTFDTMLAIKILYNGLLKFGGAGLADITTGIFSVALDKRYSKLNWSKGNALEPDMLEYAASDILSLFMVHEAFLAFEFKTLPDLLKMYYLKFLWFEHICLPSVTQMEINGIYVDVDAISATKGELEPMVKALEDDIIKTLNEADRTFKNPRSAVQMIQALKLLGGESITSTSKDVLPDYLDDHEIIGKILEWKTNAKLIEFLDSMQDSISPHTGRIHGSFNQVGTDSGRFSASSPNLQQLPRDKRIRKIFKPQKDGWLMVVADYSQLELVICAEITQDPEMLRAYREKIDLHKLTASFVTGKESKDITKDDRQLAKAINFGLIYGMGAKKFRIYSKLSYGVSISLEQAFDTKAVFMSKYTHIPMWHEQANQDARRCQIMPSFTLGKRYRLNRHPAQTAGYRFSSYVNSQDQGTGGDIAKLAIYLLEKYIELNFLTHKVMIISVVHDEIILEVHESIADLMAEKLSEAMIIAAKVWIASIPVEAESGIGDNWSVAKP